MSTFTLELNQPIEPGAAIRIEGALPCEVCLDAGWVAWTNGTGEPCQACQHIDGEDENLTMA